MVCAPPRVAEVGDGVLSGFGRWVLAIIKSHSQIGAPLVMATIITITITITIIITTLLFFSFLGNFPARLAIKLPTQHSARRSSWRPKDVPFMYPSFPASLEKSNVAVSYQYRLNIGDMLWNNWVWRNGHSFLFFKRPENFSKPACIRS